MKAAFYFKISKMNSQIYINDTANNKTSFQENFKKRKVRSRKRKIYY